MVSTLRFLWWTKPIPLSSAVANNTTGGSGVQMTVGVSAFAAAESFWLLRAGALTAAPEGGSGAHSFSLYTHSPSFPPNKYQ